MRPRLVLLSAATCLLLSLGGCGEDPATEGLIVAASVPPHAWLVEQVAGTSVEVLSLTDAGDDPHTYMPSDAQVSDVMRARIWFRSGVPFENGPWSRVPSASSRLQVIDLRDGVELRHMAPCGHDHDHAGHEHSANGGEDPHTWLGTACLLRQADTIADALATADPAGAETYRRNAVTLKARVHATRKRVEARLAQIQNRRLYLFHPAWGYFCDEFDLVQVPIEIEGKAPSEAELTTLLVQALEDRVTVIFVQPQIRGASAAAVAQAIDAKIEYLDPLARDVLANLERVAETLAANLN